MTLLKAKSRILQTFILRISGKKLNQIALSQRISSKHFFVWFEVIDQEMCHSFHCVRDAVMKTVTTHYFTHCSILIKKISTIKLLWIDPYCCFSTGPAFQEFTGSCHENDTAPKAVSSDLQSTNGLTVDRDSHYLGTLSTIIQHFTQWNPVTHCCLLMALCAAGCIPQAKLPSLNT